MGSIFKFVRFNLSFKIMFLSFLIFEQSETCKKWVIKFRLETRRYTYFFYQKFHFKHLNTSRPSAHQKFKRHFSIGQSTIPKPSRTDRFSRTPPKIRIENTADGGVGEKKPNRTLHIYGKSFRRGETFRDTQRSRVNNSSAIRKKSYDSADFPTRTHTHTHMRAHNGRQLIINRRQRKDEDKIGRRRLLRCNLSDKKFAEAAKFSR